MFNPYAANFRIGIAGWSIPPVHRRQGSQKRTLLEQYAGLFNAVEINTSFYRPHRIETYQRWALSVPEKFRFAVKVPRRITHERRLAKCDDEVDAFMSCLRGLGDKLGALLVQLPPSCQFDERVSRIFFRLLRRDTSVLIACEPRNTSWFTAVADGLFEELRLTRVSADPIPHGCDFDAAGNSQSAYLRLHGSPMIYYSSYPAAYLESLRADFIHNRSADETWCIFDNTAAGAAWYDAQILQALLAK